MSLGLGMAARHERGVYQRLSGVGSGTTARRGAGVGARRWPGISEQQGGRSPSRWTAAGGSISPPKWVAAGGHWGSHVPKCVAGGRATWRDRRRPRRPKVMAGRGRLARRPPPPWNGGRAVRGWLWGKGSAQAAAAGEVHV